MACRHNGELLKEYRQHARQQIGAKERKADDDVAVGLGGVKDAMRRTTERFRENLRMFYRGGYTFP